MMLEDIRSRHKQDEADFNNVSKGLVHQDRGELLSLIDRHEQLAKFMDMMVAEMNKPLYATDSGTTKLLVFETLLQRYAYYKHNPSDLKSFFKALEKE